MPRDPITPDPRTPREALAQRLDSVERAIRLMKRPGAFTLNLIDIDNYNDPVEGELVLDYITYSLWFYHEDEWWPVGAMNGVTYTNECSIGDSMSDTVKTAAGWLIGWEFYNHGKLPAFVYLYDNTAASDPILKRIRIPARGGANVAQVNVKFNTGLTIACGGNPGATGGVDDLVELNLTYR